MRLHWAMVQFTQSRDFLTLFWLHRFYRRNYWEWQKMDFPRSFVALGSKPACVTHAQRVPRWPLHRLAKYWGKFPPKQSTCSTHSYRFCTCPSQKLGCLQMPYQAQISFLVSNAQHVLRLRQLAHNNFLWTPFLDMFIFSRTLPSTYLFFSHPSFEIFIFLAPFLRHVFFSRTLSSTCCL